MRVCSRFPYPVSSSTAIPNLEARRSTAADGAVATSSGTNPSHDNTHTCTATPSIVVGDRFARTNTSSAGVNVKYRINSSRLISPKPRSPDNSSSENTSPNL